MIISDFNLLIETYNLVNSKDCLNDIKSEIENMSDLIGKFKFEKIKSHPDYLKINFLSNMSIRKVRKPLLNSCFEQIKTFNEELKIKYPNKKWINNLHTKDNWLNEILNLIKKISNILLYDIENICGYNQHEKSRIDFDFRIVGDNDISSNYYFYDFKEDNKEWSEKICCVCIKDIKNDFSINDKKLFDKGKKYFYRKKTDGQINVYPCEWSYIFEGDSFYEYFLSPDSRDRRLDEIFR
jgi:hypothetical protein